MILIPQLPEKALVVVGNKKRNSKIASVATQKLLSPQLTSKIETTQSPRRTTENDDLQIVQIINPTLRTTHSPVSGQTGTLRMNSRKMSIQNQQNQAAADLETSYFPVLQLKNGQIVSGEIKSGQLSQQMIIEHAMRQNSNNNLGPLIHIQTLNLESLDSVSPQGQTGRSTLRPVSDSRNNGCLPSKSRKKPQTQQPQLRFSQDKTSKSGRSSPVKQHTTFLTKPQQQKKVNRFSGGVDLSKEQKIVANDHSGHSPPMMQDQENDPDTPKTSSVATSPLVQTQVRQKQRNLSEKD